VDLVTVPREEETEFAIVSSDDQIPNPKGGLPGVVSGPPRGGRREFKTREHDLEEDGAELLKSSCEEMGLLVIIMSRT
jgi:hypothetical protein